MKYSRSALAGIIFIAVLSLAAQTNKRETAIRYYQNGNDKEAISALEALVKSKEYSSDAEMFNYLGLAYSKTDEDKKARKMFEKAVKLAPQNATYRANLAYVYLLLRQVDKSRNQAETALQIDPSNVTAHFVSGTGQLWNGNLDKALVTAEKMIGTTPQASEGYLLKADVLVALLGKRVTAGSTPKAELDLLRQAVDTLEIGVANSQPQNRPGIDEKLEGIRVFYNFYNKDKKPTATGPQEPEPGVTPVKILRKPQAKYTDRARSAGVSGTVRVAVLLGANGKIQHILKLWGIGYGLDEQAIKAARQIVFEPKMKDGKPVSTVVILEYSFEIY